MLYATAGTRRAVIALEPRTGELKWSYSLDEGARHALGAAPVVGRGLSAGPTQGVTTASST